MYLFNHYLLMGIESYFQFFGVCHKQDCKSPCTFIILFLQDTLSRMEWRASFRVQVAKICSVLDHEYSSQPIRKRG